MNNKILRSNSVFEPHIIEKNSLPFIFHKNLNKNSRCNFHENLELLYFMEGTGRVRCGNELFEVKAGDFMVINPYLVHQIMVDEAIHFSCLIIDNSFCKANDINIHSLFIQQKIQDATANAYYQKVIDAYSEDGFWGKTAIKCAILTLLLYIYQNYSTPNTNAIEADERAFQYVRIATEYIRQNISKKIALEDISKAVGLSMYHFSREFKKTIGYSVMQYVNMIRCEHAQELLISGKYKIKEVALLCGFDNYSYFSNIYKTYMGVLPSEQTFY